jgi:hypothetical protein
MEVQVLSPPLSPWVSLCFQDFNKNKKKQRRLVKLDTKGIPVARKVCVLDKSLILTLVIRLGSNP